MLRATNPSPYMYLLNVPDAEGDSHFSVVGSSPEALVTVKDGKATTHPIAGTRVARGHRGGGTCSWRRSCWPMRRNAPSI